MVRLNFSLNSSVIICYAFKQLCNVKYKYILEFFNYKKRFFITYFGNPLFLRDLYLIMELTEQQILSNIIAIRNKRGYSQEYLASKIGMKQSGYGHIEKGDRRLPVSLLLQIAVALDVHVVDIIIYPHNFSPGDTDGDLKATLTVELKKDKKDQVLRLVFGEHNLEILNK